MFKVVSAFNPIGALAVISTLLVAGCGGAGGSPANIAALACETEAKTQLSAQNHLYKLDQAALAASMRSLDGNERFLSAEIVIDPGLTQESKQKLECTVRMSDDGSQATVLNQRFIW